MRRLLYVLWALAGPPVCAQLMCQRPPRRPTKPSPLTIMAWARQLPRAVSGVHENLHLVHRDLKPGNVLVSGKGADAQLVVSDAGRAHWESTMGNKLLRRCAAHALTKAGSPPRARAGGTSAHACFLLQTLAPRSAGLRRAHAEH